MDATERALLEKTVRDAVSGAVAGDDTASVDGVLHDLGWLDMLHAEPRDATGIVFEVLGSTNARATVLDDVVVAALGMEPRAGLAVLLPRFTSWDAPGRIEGDRVHAEGLATARVADAADVLVVCRGSAGPSAVELPVATAAITTVRGIDPHGGMHTVSVEGPGAARASRLDADAWESAVAAGRRALAHQIVGATRAILDLARTHALERVQFGRPVAQFQAVRHRLAEALVAIEALEATLAVAWDEPGPVTAAAAKAVAGRTARTVATHCQQVLAGVGFTTEHPFHRFLRRTMVLEGILGTADDIALDVGRQLLAQRRVPSLVEL